MGSRNMRALMMISITVPILTLHGCKIRFRHRGPPAPQPMGLLHPNQGPPAPQTIGFEPPKQWASSPQSMGLLPPNQWASCPRTNAPPAPKAWACCPPKRGLPALKPMSSPKGLLLCQPTPHGPVLGIPEGPVAVPVPTPLVPCSASPKDVLLHRPLVTARGPELWLFGRGWGTLSSAQTPQVGLCSLRITVCLLSLFRLACCPSSWPATSLVSTLIVGFSVPVRVSVMH